MKRRPSILVVLAAVLVAIAVSMPLQIMKIYGHGFDELPAILLKLTYLNWLTIGAQLVTACLVLEASERLRYAVPVAIILVAVNNFFVGFHATDFSPWTATLATFAFAALHLPLTRKEILLLMDNPARRWWRMSTRKLAQVPVVMTWPRAEPMRAETFDLSTSGMFIALKSEALDQKENLKIQKRVQVCLSLGTLAQIRCEARVVRQTEGRGRYPSGVGIEFIDLSREQRAELKKYLDQSPSR